MALFRRVGDRLYAANTLFIMAQRAMVAGRADDEVHGWLTESHALAVAAGSEGETLHPLVGFSWLAWLRGDHERGRRADGGMPAGPCAGSGTGGAWAGHCT